MAAASSIPARPWSERDEDLLLRLLIARVGVINMRNPRDMLREIVDMTGTLRNWGMRELSAVDVVVEMQALSQRYFDFLWFIHLPGVTYDSIWNRVTVSKHYFDCAVQVRKYLIGNFIHLICHFKSADMGLSVIFLYTYRRPIV